MAMALPKQEEEKILQLVCGNAIAEIGGKNLQQLWQCHCRKWEEKKIVVAEIWGGIKKISVTFTIFLQHFHNKSHVISYYQFKFEFNTDITFLIQQ